MTHYIKVIALGLCLCSLSSCLNIIEELQLNRDGSGVYLLTFDLNKMMDDEFTKNMLHQMIEEQGSLSYKQDSLIKIDSTLYFRDMPEVDRRKMGNAEFWNRVKLLVKADEKEKMMQFSLQIDFDEITDIDYFYQNLDKLEAQNAFGNTWSQNSWVPENMLFELKKKKLIRLSAPQQSELKGEELDFAKMFFQDATYKTIYHLPGKVKKTSIPGANIDTNTVTVIHNFIDVLEEKAAMEGEIKFK